MFIKENPLILHLYFWLQGTSSNVFLTIAEKKLHDTPCSVCCCLALSSIKMDFIVNAPHSWTNYIAECAFRCNHGWILNRIKPLKSVWQCTYLKSDEKPSLDRRPARNGFSLNLNHMLNIPESPNKYQLGGLFNPSTSGPISSSNILNWLYISLEYLASLFADIHHSLSVKPNWQIITSWPSTGMSKI